MTEPRVPYCLPPAGRRTLMCLVALFSLALLPLLPAQDKAGKSTPKAKKTAPAKAKKTAPAKAKKTAPAKDRLVRLDGKAVNAPIKAIDSDGKVVLAQGKPLELADYWKIRPAKSEPSKLALDIDVYLDAGFLRAKNLQAENGKLRAQWVGGRLEVPLSTVRAMLLSTANIEEAERTFNKKRYAGNVMDALVALGKEGSVLGIEGKFVGMNAKEVKFEFRGAVKSIDRKKVYGIVLGGQQQPPAAWRFQVSLVDGSRLRGDELTMAGGTVTLDVGDAGIKLPWKHLDNMLIRSKRLRFLAELEPMSATHKPIVGPYLQWRRNRNTMNRLMVIDERVHETGIGMHAPATLTYAMPKDAKQFAVTIGLDQNYGAKGDCVFVIEADDKEVLRQRLKGSDRGKNVVVPVAGAKRMTLSVEAGENFDLGDHANWGSARIIF